MVALYELYISYAQVAVFEQRLEKPFNNWTDGHVAQGFSWREGSVSFAVPDGGDCLVEVLKNDEVSEFAPSVIREIWVPFTTVAGAISVGSITDEQPLDIKAGEYQLIYRLHNAFEHEGRVWNYRIELVFIRSDEPMFKIMKSDSEMNPPDSLILTADPA